MKKFWSYFKMKTINLFWILPLLIVVSICVGFFLKFGPLDQFNTSLNGNLCDISGLLKLEILPFLALAFSVYLIIRQSRKICKHKATLPETNNRGLFKFIISYLRLPKRIFIPSVAYWMLFFWSIGWGLYICALWSNFSSDSSVAEILGYSAMASLDLFLLDINGNILDSIGDSIEGFNSAPIKGGIIITSIFAAFSSFSIIIKLFLNRLLSTLHASKATIDNNHNHIYIFWGINNKSITLANSIKEHDNRSYIVYVEHIDTESNDTDGIANIVNYVSPDNSKIELIDLDDRTLYLYSTAELKEVKNDTNLWSHIGLEQLDSLLKELSKFTPHKRSEREPSSSEELNNIANQIHVLFLSEDRDKNISGCISIVDYFKLLSENNIHFKNIEKVIYCQTRRDSVTSIIEDSRTNIQNQIEVRVIDESILSVGRLKEDIDCHPIKFVDIEVGNKEIIGTVRDQITSLIIGFGETGRDTLRFLYEFGAFLSPTPNISIRTPFHCHVIDPNSSELSANFMANHPAIFRNNSQTKISFYNTTDKSAVFYQLLNNIAQSINFIVVAVGDDETNITVAVNVLKYIRRKRENLSKLIILVRAYSQESFSHLVGIANHYNRVLKNESKNDVLIKVFGQVEDIFTYGNIVANTFKLKAMEFYDVYDAAYVLTDEGKRYGGQRTSWQDRRKKALSSNKLSDIEDLRRKESQDFSNAWHALTKIQIIDAVLTEYCGNTFGIQYAKLLADKMFNPKEDVPVREMHPTHITYPKLDHEFEENLSSIISKLMTNMAKTEHLRWVAAHEALGYEFGDKQEDGTTKDIIHKWHSCMVQWEALDLLPVSSVRLYDYLVIETTLKMLENESKKTL